MKSNLYAKQLKKPKLYLSCSSVLLFLAILLGPTPSFAYDLAVGQEAGCGVSIASGKGVASIVPYRLGFQKELCKQWQTQCGWPVTGYVEGSFYELRGKKGNNPGSHSRLNALALALAFRIGPPYKTQIGWPYFELGVGGSFFSKKEIGGRELGIHFQFEDRIGVGVRFGECRQFDIAYRAVHFSNAYLGPQNNGINLHMLVLGYWF